MTTTDKYNQYLMMPHKYLPISYAQFYARTKKGMTIEEIINTKGLKDLTKENNKLYKEYKSKVKKPYKRASFLVLLDL